MAYKSVSVAALILALGAGGAWAQSTAVFNAEDRAADAVEDIEDDVRDDFTREIDRFGNVGRPLGWSGSIALRATATSGNTDTADLGIGTRVGYFDGVNGHMVTLSYDYSEDNSVASANSLLFGYDYTREIGRNTFFYGQIQLAYDEFSSYETDAFFGVGLGYRIINTAQTQWSVQAGPGYRILEDQSGARFEEAAASLGSAYSTRLSDTALFSWDTDVLWSDLDTLVTNEFAITVSLSRQLALRTSLLSEYRSDPLPGFDDTDHTLGISVVYNFN